MLLLRQLRPVHCPACTSSWWPIAASHVAVHLPNGRHMAPATSALGSRPATMSWSPHCKSQQRAAATAQVSTSRLAASVEALPTTAVGQVMASEANYVRVDVHGEDSSNDTAVSQRMPQRQLLCTVRALLKKVRQNVLVGDHVRVGSIDWVEGRGQVEEVFHRNSELTDPAVANVDHVLLLFGLTQPPFEEQQVTRFLVSIEASGLPITLALNKADLLEPEEIEQRVQQCASWGYTALPVSCETGEGVVALAEALAGRTSVVAGPSGAGKSSLINALRMGQHRPGASALELSVLPVVTSTQQSGAPGGGGSQADESSSGSYDETDFGSSSDGDGIQMEGQERYADQRSAAAGSASTSYAAMSSRVRRSGAHHAPLAGFLAVGEMSKAGRGKHTTTTVSLIPLPGGGAVADTPGFSQPTLEGVASTELAYCFPEIREALEAGGGCRFSDCLHLAEPGCVVSDQGLERYEWYVRFLAEIQAREEYDVRVLQLAKKQREGATKRIIGRGGTTRYEARLDQKALRAQSRRRAKQDINAPEVADDREEFLSDLQR